MHLLVKNILNRNHYHTLLMLEYDYIGKLDDYFGSMIFF